VAKTATLLEIMRKQEGFGTVFHIGALMRE
jgi:hypothetical protein